MDAAHIKQLLDWQQLSPTQFADRIGVGRPVVSHILSGRNKPSLEVVQRISAAFPELSEPWLLSGTGAMLKATALPAPLATASAPPAGATASLAVPAAPPAATAPAISSPEASPAPPPAAKSAEALPSAATWPAVGDPSRPATRATAVPPAFRAATGPSATPRSSVTMPPRFRPALAAGPPAVAPTLATVTPAASASTSGAVSLAEAAGLTEAAGPSPASLSTEGPALTADKETPGALTGEAVAPGPVPLAAAAEAGVPAGGQSVAQPVGRPGAGGEALPASALAAGLGEPGKAIRRIVIFYRDGSFADYQPES